MPVLHLVQPSNEDTVEFAECILALARRGEVRDISATYTRQGVEHIGLTGRYRAHPAEAVRAAFRKIALLSKQSRKAGSDD